MVKCIWRCSPKMRSECPGDSPQLARDPRNQNNLKLRQCRSHPKVTEGKRKAEERLYCLCPECQTFCEYPNLGVNFQSEKAGALSTFTWIHPSLAKGNLWGSYMIKNLSFNSTNVQPCVNFCIYAKFFGVYKCYVISRKHLFMLEFRRSMPHTIASKRPFH